MNIGHQRHRRFLGDLLEGSRRLFIGTGDADDIRAGLRSCADLGECALNIRRQRVGHRLDGNGRVAADQDIADADLA